MLEPGCYLVVCLAFNHWWVSSFILCAFDPLMFSLFDQCFRHTGLGSDPGLYPDYILALHSSKRLLAEQLSSSYHLLVMFISFTASATISMKEIISQQADSIISLTVARGQRHEGREGMTAYYLTKVIVMMIINMVMTKVMMIMICWPWSWWWLSWVTHG